MGANQYVYDRLACRTFAISTTKDGTTALGPPFEPQQGWISLDGRKVAFFAGDTFGFADTNASFDVFINDVPLVAPNTPPTVSDITNRTTTTGVVVGPISFTVADAETAVGSLVVTATSSNTTLVPNTNVTLGGSGADRTVTVTPAAGQTGTATGTVTVTDAGGLTATDTFTVTVNAAAQAVTVGGLPNGTAQVFNPTGGTLAAGATQTFFAGSKSNVRTATADVNGDGVADFIGGWPSRTGRGFACGGTTPSSTRRSHRANSMSRRFLGWPRSLKGPPTRS